MPKEQITMTVRLPRPIWLKLRRLQEDGAIVSINQAVIEGLELLIKRKGG